MKHVLLLVILLLVTSNPRVTAQESNDYRVFEEAITWKTQQIATTHATDHNELAQLYVSRGEFHIKIS